MYNHKIITLAVTITATDAGRVTHFFITGWI